MPNNNHTNSSSQDKFQKQNSKETAQNKKKEQAQNKSGNQNQF